MRRIDDVGYSTTMQLLPNLYRVPGVVANVFALIDPDGVTLVDTGLPHNHHRLLHFVARLDGAARPIRRLLITHADRDHMGSVAALRELTGARVYASRLEGEAMAQGRETRRLRVTGPYRLALAVLRPLFARTRPAHADEFVEDGQTLPFFGGLTVLATPGHTPGHLSFYSAAHGVLFAGDSLRVIGKHLRVSSGPNTHDAARAQASAERQYALRPRLICCGHGAPRFMPD
jgi:glyoxylase-like metal-dependent hydrolase (beta-lactamase superfamily II)